MWARENAYGTIPLIAEDKTFVFFPHVHDGIYFWILMMTFYSIYNFFLLVAATTNVILNHHTAHLAAQIVAKQTAQSWKKVFNFFGTFWTWQMKQKRSPFNCEIKLFFFFDSARRSLHSTNVRVSNSFSPPAVK